jgi:hypothetical protein
MKKRVGGFAIWVLVFHSAQAGVIVDQEVVTYPDKGYIGYILDYPGDYIAQTFTVGHTGQLTGVGVQVSLHRRFPYTTYTLRPPIDDLYVKLVRTNSAGAPSIDEVLAEATIDGSSLKESTRPGPFTDIDFGSWQVQVTAGDVFAVTLSSDQTYYVDPHVGTDYIWYRSPRNEFPGGEFYIYSPEIFGPEPFKNHYYTGADRTIDAGYRVFINAVPEPSSIVLSTLCCLWLVGGQFSRWL